MKHRVLTMVILLSCAHSSLWAIRTINDLFFQETLLTFSYPPFFESPKQNFGRAVTTDSVPRGVYGNVSRGGNGMDIFK
jgi:hypothetical protein